MFKAVRDHENTESTRRRRKRRLRHVPTLPTLLTLGNLVLGFAAIYACGLEMYDFGRGIAPDSKATLMSEFFEANAPTYLAVGFWLLIGAAVCDALDGRVARKTGAMSKFGEQLDTLADTVSFGLAPALMMVTLIHREFPPGASPFVWLRFGQFSVLIGIIFLCCAALRLARFTVEATAEEASHEGFRGLPSPGAAAGLVALIFLHEYVTHEAQWLAILGAFIARVLPFAGLALALLMVSRLPYRHFVSTLLKRRPLEHVVVMVLAIPLVWIFTEIVAVAVAWTFVLSGPVSYVRLWRRGELPADEDTGDTQAHEPAEEEDTLRKQQA